MTNKEAIAILENLKTQGEAFFSRRLALDLSIKNKKKDKCSSCKHYDKDYGETCLNPEGTCRVFEYDGYKEAEECRR